MLDHGVAAFLVEPAALLVAMAWFRIWQMKRLHKDVVDAYCSLYFAVVHWLTGSNSHFDWIRRIYNTRMQDCVYWWGASVVFFMLSHGTNFWCWDKMRLAVKVGISGCCSVGLSTLGWCSGFVTPHNHDCWLWHLYVQIVAIQLCYRTRTIMCIVTYYISIWTMNAGLKAWLRTVLVSYCRSLLKSSTKPNTTQAVGPVYWCWFGEAWQGCPWLLWSRSLCLLFFEIFWIILKQSHFIMFVCILQPGFVLFAVYRLPFPLKSCECDRASIPCDTVSCPCNSAWSLVSAARVASNI